MLQLVLGRSGYGKTEYVFNEIKKLVDNDEEVILITPEQFSFLAERRLLEDLGESKVSYVQNMSFSRLNHEISRMYGGERLPVLTSGAKAIMMQKAAFMVQDSLVLYAKNIRQNSFVNSLVKIYDEMKSCRVTVDDIFEAADSIEKQVLKEKLNDIATLIGAYDSMINGKYVDSATELTRLYEKLVGLDYFKGKTVYIDGFSGFVAQEYKVLEVIIKQAKMVYITFCSDTHISVNKHNLFYYVQMNINILKEVTKIANTKFLSPIYLENNYRAKNEELSYIEKYSYRNDIKQQLSKNENVTIYSAKNICDECNKVSSQIVDLLRNGYKASEIAVICRDLDKYKRELEFSFNKYNVPYFNDERQNITSQPIIMFVNFLLRVAIYSMRSDDIFSLLKTGLTKLKEEELSSLENYVYLWSIDGIKWKNEFENSTKGFVENITDNDKRNLEQINLSREYVVSIIEKFRKNAKNTNCAGICKAIYYALIDFGCDKGVKSLAIDLDNNGKSALAEEQGRVWDLLMQILNKLANIGGEEKISLKEFSDLFGLIVENEDLGSIPAGLDNIQIGSADRIRCNNPRAVFILGANEGAFPQAVSSAGLLSEYDRISIINTNNDFKLYSYGEILNAQEKYFAYMAMTSASEKLYVSYLMDSVPSSIVTEIKLIFPNIAINSSDDNIYLSLIQSQANAFELLASNYDKNDEFVSSLKQYFNGVDGYSSRLNAIERLNANNDLVIENKNVSRELFGENMYLSASKVEDYYNCSFKYFCKYGIHANPRAKAELNSMQVGLIIHYVLEQIIKNNGSSSLSSLDESAITLMVNKYLNVYLTTKMGGNEEFTSRFKYQFMRLSKMIVRVVLRLRDEFSQSDFEAKAFELKIGDGNENEPVKSKTIMLDDGGSISIKGSIDRVDVYNDNGTQYVRVVDYKSGKKTFSLSDVIYGLNLQMFIYLFTLCESNHELSGISSGVLYLHSSRKIFNENKRTGDGEIKKNENSGFKMQGVILNDDENQIAEHMEHNLAGNYIPVKSTSKGMSGNMVTLEELGRISRKIDSLIAQMGMNLHNGLINQNPVYSSNYKDICNFCDYKQVCMNRVEIQNKEIESLSYNEVLSMLKEDECDA